MEGWVERKDQDQDEWIRWIPMDWVGGETVVLSRSGFRKKG